MDRFSFGDTPALADKLLALVLSGRKTATTSSMNDPSATNNHVGKRWIVMDGSGQDRAVIETIELTERRFDEVDETYARQEGEGDGSLEHWRAMHRAFFTREGTYSDQMRVMCERFRLIGTLP